MRTWCHISKVENTNVAIKEISKDLLLSHYNGFKPVVIFQESKTLQNLTLISCSFYILIFSSHQNTNKFDETRSSKLVSWSRPTTTSYLPIPSDIPWMKTRDRKVSSIYGPSFRLYLSEPGTNAHLNKKKHWLQHSHSHYVF